MLNHDDWLKDFLYKIKYTYLDSYVAITEVLDCSAVPDGQDIARILENEGYIELSHLGMSHTPLIRLTRKGLEYVNQTFKE